MPNSSNRHTELQTLLTQLNLATMADVFADVALRAAKEGLSHEAYLYELARLEMEERTQRRTARLVRQSGSTFGENISDPLALSPHPDAAIASGAPQKCLVLGNGDQYYRHWQTGGRETSITSLPLLT